MLLYFDISYCGITFVGMFFFYFLIFFSIILFFLIFQKEELNRGVRILFNLLNFLVSYLSDFK